MADMEAEAATSARRPTAAVVRAAMAGAIALIWFVRPSTICSLSIQDLKGVALIVCIAILCIPCAARERYFCR